MPIQIQEINDANEVAECPLCMEPLEVDDINFFPCVCGYQVCRFCWHRIRTDENGLCPACRTSYPENPAEFKPLTGSDLQKIRNEKRQKEVQRRQKLTDNRRHLSAIRVLQKNLVFVVGLSQRLSDPEVLKKQEYFGKYGKIIKVVINNNTAYAGSQGPSSSAYVTYSKMEEALGAIQSVNNVHIDGRTLKASLGTTKYCSTYLKNQQCHKSDCMYLHELAEEEASFTKEDMQAGKHQEVEQKLIEQMLAKEEMGNSDTVITNGTSLPSLTINADRKRQRHLSGSSNHSDKKYETDTRTQSQEEDQINSVHLYGLLDAKHNIGLNETRQSKPLKYQHKLSPSIDGDPLSSECSSNAPTPPPPVPKADPTNSINADENYSHHSIQTHPISIPHTSQQTPVSVTPTDETSHLRQESTPDSIANEIARFHMSSQENHIPQQSQFLRLPTEGGPQSTNFQIPGHFPSSATAASNWQNRIPKLPDVIPVKSSSDWEAAFGFDSNPAHFPPQAAAETTPVEAGDDDLGFDPWTECTKGLADLMEKECAQTESQSSSYNVRNAYPSPTFSNSGFGLTQPNVSSGFLPNAGGGPQAMPSPLHNHLQLDPNYQANRMSNPNGFNEWKSGLRALLPTVNINFAMDNHSNMPSEPDGFRGNAVSPFGRLPPTSHTSPSAGGGRNVRPANAMGFGHWGLPSTAPNQSSFLPGFARPPNSYFPGRGDLGERYSPVAPPPGLSATPHMQQADPAIIATGQKPPMPVQPSNQQQSVMDETPHWMKSLQTLTDFDNPLSTAQSSSFHEQQAQAFQSNVSWPYTSSVLPPFGTSNQPPPGFESRLPYTNSAEFGLRHNLLENQS